MEQKKTPKADLQNKRGLFMEIGLVVSLGIVIVALSYSQKEREVEKLDNEIIAVEEELIEVTRQDQKPPEPIKQQQVQVLSDFIKVVQNDQKIETEFDFTEFSEDIVVVEQEIVEEEVVEDEALPTDEAIEGDEPMEGEQDEQTTILMTEDEEYQTEQLNLF